MQSHQEGATGGRPFRTGRSGRSRLAIGRSSALVVCLLTLAALPQAALASAGVAPRQLVAVILTNHTVRTTPNGGQVEQLQAGRPITGERTVLPVLSQRVSRGRLWLQVRLPGRTFGARVPPATGWITAANTQLRRTAWHLVINLAARRVIVYRDGQPLRTFSAIVGKASTPTPTGQYFVEEDVRMPTGEPGGPFALATSDRSQVLQEFDGGPGQIAIHGVENLGGQIATAESHGCVRLTNEDITWLAAQVGPGTPVTILRS